MPYSRQGALWAAELESRLLSCMVSSSADNEKPAHAVTGVKGWTAGAHIAL